MNQNSHRTPGPYEAWPVKGDRLKRWMVVCVDPQRCPGTGKEVIAERIRTEANARLFAASSKLLAAAQFARENIDHSACESKLCPRCDLEAAISAAGVKS